MIHRYHYLVCYDISSPRRLQKVGRISRRYGTPFQYSVIYFYGSEQELDDFLDELESVIDDSEDDIRAYRINSVDSIITLGEPLLPEGIGGIWPS